MFILVKLKSHLSSPGIDAVTTPTSESQRSYDFQFKYFKAESCITKYIVMHAGVQREIDMASQKMQGPSSSGAFSSGSSMNK